MWNNCLPTVTPSSKGESSPAATLSWSLGPIWKSSHSQDILSETVQEATTVDSTHKHTVPAQLGYRIGLGFHPRRETLPNTGLVGV